ncbi:hypothetical protein PTKIN_Ptkin09bG0073800 [Pterospermum kingtungense]
MGDKEERKIPVFTVIKNGAILKNIFVINKPQAMEEDEEDPHNQKSVSEEVLTVGRHPDCNIMLTHPSISRFHLQIHSKPSSQKLSVLDLSSVHGTWVSGKKIDPGVVVELNEGDTIKVGGSTRIYKLHWIPMCRAYDMEIPFLSAMDVSMEREKEGESAEKSHQGENTVSTENECTEAKFALLVEGKEEEETSQDQSCVPAEHEELDSMDVVLEGIRFLFSDESSGVLLNKEIPSAPPMPENMNYSLYDDERNNLEDRELLGLQSELSSYISAELVAADGVVSKSQDKKFGEDNESILPETVTEAISKGEKPETSLRKPELKPDPLDNTDPLFVEELYNYSATENVEETENRRQLQESQEKRDVSTVSHLMESINSTLQEDNVLLNIKSQQVQISKLLSPLKENENAAVDEQSILIVNLESTCSDSNECCLSVKIEDTENQILSEKDYESESSIFYSAPFPTESVNSSLPICEVLSEVTDDKRNPTPQSLFAPAVLYEDENLDSSPLRMEQKSNLDSIWSRRGKPASVLQIQTGRSTGKAVETTKNAENKSVPRSLFVSSEEAEEEIFTPDKENFTPNTLLMKALKRKDKLEEVKHYSKATFSPDLQPEDNLIASDKENQTPKLIKVLKSARKTSQNQPRLEQERMVMREKVERVPFQYLPVESACPSVSEASVLKTTARSTDSITFNSKTIEKKIAHPSLNKSVGEGRRTWTMIADTTSLLDRESRKSLQLLQGLKGTRLIIPRMVIRELDCLKRRGSLFRRTTEASSVLEWIENCMVKSKWWIHVQSTMEEGGPIAPTPPATPQSQYSEGSAGNPFGTTKSAPFSPWGGLMEIASPTAEDHILDCALIFRKMKRDGQFVLLSNDVTLKIKAMAEGLICETAQEFRESLVNPFSERFMWADSSPRGQTWSVLDDVVLRDKYNRCPLKKPSKGDVKGLKLILLHNSHYGQISSVR